MSGAKGKRYSVDVFTIHGYPESIYDLDTPEEILNLIRNVSDPVSGAREIRIRIHPANVLMYPSLEERTARDQHDAAMMKAVFSGKWEGPNFIEASQVAAPSLLHPRDFCKEK